MAEYYGTQDVGVSLLGIEDVPHGLDYIIPYLVIGPRVGDIGSMSLVWVFDGKEYSSMIEFDVEDTAFMVLDGYVDLLGAYSIWVDSMFDKEQIE